MPKVKKPKANRTITNAGVFNPIGTKLRTAKRPAGNDVKALDVDSYANLKKREKVGDNLEHDHIPSSAALKRAEEKRLGRKLTKQEADALHNKANAIEVPKDVHAKSDTFRGKNTKKQIEDDAADLSKAANRDYATTRKNLLAHGYSAKDVDAALDKIKAENRKKGI
ncbi:hypothetical protein ACFWN2_13365 [Lentzea sp. NPDC058436]|uniref:hypothetical protein n=1 Tax=Lentzea sp. NPDC058436 TaxID=3346499 RepID=UPI003649731C